MLMPLELSTLKSTSASRGSLAPVLKEKVIVEEILSRFYECDVSMGAIVFEKGQGEAGSSQESMQRRVSIYEDFKLGGGGGR